MNKKQAMKLHNRDEVEIKVDNIWGMGYVLGEPLEQNSKVIIQVQHNELGFIEVDHNQIR